MGKNFELYKTAKEKDSDEQLNIVIADILDTLQREYPNFYNTIVTPLEDMAYSISKDEAERIVRNMKPRGQQWSYGEVAALCESKGITEHLVDYYLAINMAYNDYYPTAAMFGLQKNPEFFFSIAKDFITDADAEPHKVSMYFIH